jgi:hypothetical protein
MEVLLFVKTAKRAINRDKYEEHVDVRAGRTEQKSDCQWPGCGVHNTPSLHLTPKIFAAFMNRKQLKDPMFQLLTCSVLVFATVSTGSADSDIRFVSCFSCSHVQSSFLPLSRQAQLIPTFVLFLVSAAVV